MYEKTRKLDTVSQATAIVLAAWRTVMAIKNTDLDACLYGCIDLIHNRFLAMDIEMASVVMSRLDAINLDEMSMDAKKCWLDCVQKR